jgi:hypothetical protein
MSLCIDVYSLKNSYSHQNKTIYLKKNNEILTKKKFFFFYGSFRRLFIRPRGARRIFFR